MPTRVRNRNGEFGFVTNDGTFIADVIGDPSDDVGVLGSLGIGVVNKILSLPDRVAALSGSDPAQQRLDDREQLMQPLADRHPISSFIGGQPDVLIPGRKIAQTVIGGVSGALENPEEPIPGAVGGAVGGLLGDVIGQRASRFIAAKMAQFSRPVTARQVQRQAIRRLTGQGMHLSRTQRNAVGGQTIEAGLQALPFFSQIAGRPLRQQQELLNQSAMRVFGLKTDSAAPGVLKLARANISRKFDLVENSIPPGKLPPEIAETISTLNVLGKGGKIMDVSGVLDGAQTLRVRSALNEQMSDLAMAGGVPEANLLRSTLQELDDFINEGIKFTRPRDYHIVLNALDQARSEWRFLTALRKGKSVSQGQINPLSVSNALKKIYPGFDIGRELPGRAKTFGSMLQDLDVLSRGLSDSGTAGRTLGIQLLTGTAALADIKTIAIPAILAQWAATQPGEAAGAAVGRRVGIAAGRATEENEQ